MTKKINKIAIEIALRNKGFSQARLAELLQVSREAVSKWISGESFPRPDKLLKLGSTLDLKYQELVCEVHDSPPSFAFRFRANIKQNAGDEERARHIGELLVQLASCLRHPQFENLPTLKSPSCSTAYVEQVCSSLREDMGLAQDAPISIDILLKKSRSLGIILVPVLWGKKDIRENALRIYLPNSHTTWIYLNLDSASCDFMFWFVHELGHAYAPSLTGEEGEIFADLFAQHLLYPTLRSKKLYKKLINVQSPGIIINKIIEEADGLQISPITVYMSIENYCKENSLPSLLPSSNPYPAFNKYCLEQETIAERYFGKSQLDVADYLIKSKEIFGADFFDALKKLKETRTIPQGFIQQVTQMSLLDSKTLWAGL